MLDYGYFLSLDRLVVFSSVLRISLSRKRLIFKFKFLDLHRARLDNILLECKVGLSYIKPHFFDT